VTSLVARVAAIRSLAGEWLAHVAPRERIQILAHDHEARAVRIAARREKAIRRKRPPGNPNPSSDVPVPNNNASDDAADEPVSKRTRSTLLGPVAALYSRHRCRSHLDSMYVWDFQSGPVQDYLVFQSTRWRLVTAIARDWCALLPAPGYCHIASDLTC
jgi:hypothetical protein